MKKAISNIAWKAHENQAVYNLMVQCGFTGLEIAPSIFLDNSPCPYDEPPNLRRAAKKVAAELELVSMQALLYGAQGLFMFKNDTAFRALSEYCKKAIDFASDLGIPNLVFGSPKNRIIPDDMDRETAWEKAVGFFKDLGEYALQHNTCISMEANATDYGGNFITKTQEAVKLISAVDSRGFMLNLDMGTMSLENEDAEIIDRAMHHTRHVHISEGFLNPVYEGDPAVHKERAALLKQSGYQGYISIEMASLSTTDNQDHVQRAMDFVNEIYTG